MALVSSRAYVSRPPEAAGNEEEEVESEVHRYPSAARTARQYRSLQRPDPGDTCGALEVRRVQRRRERAAKAPAAIRRVRLHDAAAAQRSPAAPRITAACARSFARSQPPRHAASRSATSNASSAGASSASSGAG